MITNEKINYLPVCRVASFRFSTLSTSFDCWGRNFFLEAWKVQMEDENYAEVSVVQLRSGWNRYSNQMASCLEA